MTKDSRQAARDRAAQIFAEVVGSAVDLSGDYSGVVVRATGNMREQNNWQTGQPETVVSASFVVAPTGMATGDEVSSAALRELSTVYIDIDIRKSTDVSAFIDTLVDFGVFDETLTRELYDAYYGNDPVRQAEIITALLTRLPPSAPCVFEVKRRRKITNPKYPYNYSGLRAR